MSQDVIAQLGTLALASRLKRLSQRLQRDASRIYRERHLNFNARWFPVAYVLTRTSPMSVTAVADAIGLTHVAVNQVAGEMSRQGLLRTPHYPKDERRRLLSLSAKGKRTIANLQPVWESTRRCARRLLTDTGHDLLECLSAVEAAIEEKDMYERVREDLDRRTQKRRKR